MMRRASALVLLGTLAALLWAPSLVSGASPTPALASSVAQPQDPGSSPSASANTAMLATPAPSSVVNAPAATASSSPAPAAPAGSPTSPSPAASSVAAPAAASATASANAAPGTSTASEGGNGPAPSASARAAPRASDPVLAGAPQRVPQASPTAVASAKATAGRDGVPSSLSRAVLLAMIAVAALALLAMSFVMLGAHQAEARPEIAGDDGGATLSPEERSALATQATLARRAARRARVRAANDPILRAMGFGSDEPADEPLPGAGTGTDTDGEEPEGRGRPTRRDR